MEAINDLRYIRVWHFKKHKTMLNLSTSLLYNTKNLGGVMKHSHTHCVKLNGKKHIWNVESLWRLSKDLEVFQFRINDFDGFDEDYWFGDRHQPTIRKILEHHRKILDADYSYPIIIGEDGSIMDGVHRICRAFIEGKEFVPAVRFEKNPLPDKVNDDIQRS